MGFFHVLLARQSPLFGCQYKELFFGNLVNAASQNYIHQGDNSMAGIFVKEYVSDVDTCQSPRCHGRDTFLLILQTCLKFCLQGEGWHMESRESIIADLRRLGVKVHQILAYHPTDQQLREMRDGLSRLHKVKTDPARNS